MTASNAPPPCPEDEKGYLIRFLDLRRGLKAPAPLRDTAKSTIYVSE